MEQTAEIGARLGVAEVIDPGGSKPDRLDWVLSASAVFLGSVLLFGVEPMVAKAILPWFGGAASVWTTCMLFFQSVLLLGYSYVHIVSGWKQVRRIAVVHVGLLAFSLIFLTVLPQSRWKPAGDENPVLMILGALGTSVGLPFFLLSCTSPLVQALAARKGRPAPYRLFALSNLASLLTLLVYPLVVEWLLTVREQAFVWSCAYVCYALLISGVIWRSRAAQVEPVRIESPESVPPAAGDRFLWTALAACTSALFLAGTNHISQTIAAIPFLWIVPLGVYLLSFILCFDGDKWYRRKIFLPLQAVSLAGLAYGLVPRGAKLDLRLALPPLAAGLFCLCMYCHGELALRKPSPRYLTQYYLLISLGSAIGALLVTVISPITLSGVFEFAVALACCAMLTLLLEYRKAWITDLLWAALAVFTITLAGAQIQAYTKGARVLGRNFYGAVKVIDSDAPAESAQRTLIHGLISHGSQFLDRGRRREATTYYSPGSGVQLAIGALPSPARVGVIGLGAGTLAAYGRKGDYYRFYEINPLVIDFARQQFTYVGDSDAKVDLVLADGRSGLEREGDENYDLLVVDAFAGDAIPVHLLSLEAFHLYFRHLKPEGILALHISNESLDLEPVLQKAATQNSYNALVFENAGNTETGQSQAFWALLSRGKLRSLLPVENGGRPLHTRDHLRPWTDGYSNLVQILK